MSEGIDSALAQAEVGELILVDDGSSDDSADICRKYCAIDQRVKFYSHPDNKNLGSGPTRNLGLSKVNLPYVSFLDSDDYFMPDRFVSSLNILEADPVIDGVYCMVRNLFPPDYFNRNEHPEYIVLKKKVLPANLFAFVVSESEPYFPMCSLLLRTDKLSNLHFDDSFRVGQDIDFIYQLSLHLCLVSDTSTQAPIVRRLHDSNITHTHDAAAVRYALANKWFTTIYFTLYSRDEIRAMTKNYFFRTLQKSGIQPSSKFKKLFYFIFFLLKRPLLIYKFILAPASVNRLI